VATWKGSGTTSAPGSGNWIATTSWDTGVVPTSTENVIFPSGTYTVTVNGTANCANFTVTATSGTVTFLSSTTSAINVNGGSFTLASNVVWNIPTNTLVINFLGNSGTITTAGVTLNSNLTFTGSALAWAFGGDVTIGPLRTVSLNSGTINLASYKLTCGFFSSSNNGTRTVDFGSDSGSITVNGNGGTLFTTSTSTNLTVLPVGGVHDVFVDNNTGSPTTVAAGNLAIGTAFSFTFKSGTYALTASGSWGVNNLSYQGYVGALNSISNNARAVHGNLDIGSTVRSDAFAAGANACVFDATSGTKTIRTYGVKLDFPFVFSGAGGTFQLLDALTAGPASGPSTRTITHTSGTISLQSYKLEAGLYSGSGALARAIDFGTGNITLTGSGTVWSTANATNFTVSGSRTVNISNGGTTAATVSAGVTAGVETNSVDFNFTTGDYNLTLAANSKFRSLNFTGYAPSSGAVGNTALTIYGNLTLASRSGIFTGGANAWTLLTNSPTINPRDIDLAGITNLGFPLVFNAAGSTFRFLRNTTLNTNYVWTAGTFNLNGFELSLTTLVRSGGSGVVSMFANGGRVNITGTSGVVLNTSPTGNDYIAGDVPIYLTPTSTPSGRTITSLGSNFSLYFSGIAQADTLSFPVGTFNIKNLTTTGFSGTISSSSAWNVYGSLFFDSSTSVSGLSGQTLNLWGSGVQETLDGTTSFPTFYSMTLYGLTGSNYKLNQNVTATNYFSFTNGAILDLNGKTLTSKRGSVSTGSATIAMSGGTIVLNGDNTSLSGQPVWDTTNPATFTGSGTISCTSNLDKYIGPAGRTLPTIEQGGTGTLEFDDDGTGTGYVLADLTLKSTVTSPTTIRLQAGATTTFTDFSLSGTPGAQVTLRSNSAGTRATISKASGTVSTSYLTIQDIAATGGATWNAFTSAPYNNVNNGNNTGWNFTAGPATNTGAFFSIL